MTTINLQRAALQLLRDCQSAGLTHLPLPVEIALPTLVEAESTGKPQESATVSEVESLVVATGNAIDATEIESVDVLLQKVAVSTSLDHSEQPATRAEELSRLAERVATCVRCRELAQTRSQTVFGVGNPHARVMFIGEAPGADEDQQGEPFVGKAGQLLNKIIDACGWQREELYICNILRCRPPENRNPTLQEANNCREYLDGQISIVAPEYIVCWGGVATNNLLGVDVPIGRMRGKFHEYGRAKVLCTYHPSYLLRNPDAKKPVWDDMKFLLNDMGLKPKQG